MNDPWKHRSANMRCETCMWYVAKELPPTVNPQHLESPVVQVGRCRRHAPSMNGYPVVYHTDWCGDHRLDELKTIRVQGDKR